MIYWALILVFVTGISCIASGYDKWSELFFGKEGSLLTVVLAGGLQDTSLFVSMAS